MVLLPARWTPKSGYIALPGFTANVIERRP